MTISQALIVLLGFSVFIFLLGKIYELLVTPVRIGRNSRLDAVLLVNGTEPQLEGTIRGLMHLRDTGKISMDVIIIDDGMDEGTKKTAQLLVRDAQGIRLCTRKELCSESIDGEVDGEGIH